jgi:hypothetical protein
MLNNSEYGDDTQKGLWHLMLHMPDDLLSVLEIILAFDLEFPRGRAFKEIWAIDETILARLSSSEDTRLKNRRAALREKAMNVYSITEALKRTRSNQRDEDGTLSETNPAEWDDGTFNTWQEEYWNPLCQLNKDSLEIVWPTTLDMYFKLLNVNLARLLEGIKREHATGLGLPSQLESSLDRERHHVDRELANTFQRVGEGWLIRYDGGDRFFLKDRKGLCYIHALISHPGTEFAAKDLNLEAIGHQSTQAEANLLSGMTPDELDSEEGMTQTRKLNDGDGATDNKTVESVRRRLREIAEERRDAESLNDQARIRKCDEESSQIHEYVGSVTDIHGKIRVMNQTSTKEGRAISKAIADAERAILEYDEGFHRHLGSSLLSGSIFKYAPEKETKWETSEEGGLSPQK